MNAGAGRLRHTIMSELGRIEDAQVMRAAAALVCANKPTAREAVVMLRRFRTGKESPGGAIGLTTALTACLNDYLARHPGTTWQVVRAAVENLADAVEEGADADNT
jgi:hypothetical protein